VPFASPEGRALFREALAEGNLEGWFALAEQFHTQADPAFCGLGTLVVALNALGVDPGSALEGPLALVQRGAARLLPPARRSCKLAGDHPATTSPASPAATASAPPRAGPPSRRSSTLRAPTARRRRHLGAIGPVLIGLLLTAARWGRPATGTSPRSAAIHAGRDVALVLDVARFKYPPHWVPVPMLWEAMLPCDPATGRSRGWALLRRRATGSSVLFHLSRASLPWSEVTRRLQVELPAALAAARPDGADELVRAFVLWMRSEAPALMEALPSALDGLAPEHRAQAEALLDALRATALFAAVDRTLRPSAGDAPTAEALTMMLLSLPEATFEALPTGAREELRALRRVAALPPLLQSEVEVLSEQIMALAVANDPQTTADGTGQCSVRVAPEGTELRAR
jgi:glutathione gamma-glutamylcysteinyltransferase